MSEELEKEQLAEEEEATEAGEAPEEDLDTLLRRINDERDGMATSDVLFKIKSDIGRDDFRAFIYHSVYFKHAWILPLYIILPPVLSFGVSIFSGSVDVGMSLVFVAIMYVLILGITLFRTERSLTRRERDNPGVMKITPTKFTFYENLILNSKRTGDIRVPYHMLSKVSETKQRFFLYFDNRKAMVIRKEDVERDADIDAFRKFIKSKAK